MISRNPIVLEKLCMQLNVEEQKFQKPQHNWKPNQVAIQMNVLDTEGLFLGCPENPTSHFPPPTILPTIDHFLEVKWVPRNEISIYDFCPGKGKNIGRFQIVLWMHSREIEMRAVVVLLVRNLTCTSSSDYYSSIVRKGLQFILNLKSFIDNRFVSTGQKKPELIPVWHFHHARSDSRAWYLNRRSQVWQESNRTWVPPFPIDRKRTEPFITVGLCSDAFELLRKLPLIGLCTYWKPIAELEEDLGRISMDSLIMLYPSPCRSDFLMPVWPMKWFLLIVIHYLWSVIGTQFCIILLDRVHFDVNATEQLSLKVHNLQRIKSAKPSISIPLNCSYLLKVGLRLFMCVCVCACVPHTHVRISVFCENFWFERFASLYAPWITIISAREVWVPEEYPKRSSDGWLAEDDNS